MALDCSQQSPFVCCRAPAQIKLSLPEMKSQITALITEPLTRAFQVSVRLVWPFQPWKLITTSDNLNTAFYRFSIWTTHALQDCHLWTSICVLGFALLQTIIHSSVSLAAWGHISRTFSKPGSHNNYISSINLQAPNTISLFKPTEKQISITWKYSIYWGPVVFLIKYRAKWVFLCYLLMSTISSENESDRFWWRIN